MKHYDFLSETSRNKIFYREPEDINKNDDKDLLAMAMGATMYTPGTYTKFAEKIKLKEFKGLTASVLCLEDSISDDDVIEAEKNIVVQLNKINKMVDSGEILESDVPFLFIRVRTPEQLSKILKENDIESFRYVVGFNLPKITAKNARCYLKTIEYYNIRFGNIFYALPILESPELMYMETRREELVNLKEILDEYRQMILTIRIGGTDFSSLFGIRRGIDFTIYNIPVIMHCISDIINAFGRVDKGYILSGVVWEYFPDGNRMLKPQLRESIFIEQSGALGKQKRFNIISDENDGLVKEVILDKANGFVGKTVIHPSHIKLVNAINAVTFEEYSDAEAILNASGGVMKGMANNKMNEVKPHYNWAKRVHDKSRIYGVLNENAKYIDLF